MWTHNVILRLLSGKHQTFKNVKLQRRWRHQATWSVPSHPGCIIKRLTMDDKDQVIDFIGRYYRDEPLTVAVNLLQSPGSRSEDLEDHSIASLQQGVSIAIVHETDGFVGVLLSDIVRRKNPVYTNKSAHCKDPKFGRILQVLEHLDRQACMWDALPDSCDTVLYLSVGTAHSAWRGKGICTLFCAESERVAKEIGATAMRVDCTSAFTAMVAAKLHYRKLCAVKYEDLPFAPRPEAPHVEASVLVKELV